NGLDSSLNFRESRIDDPYEPWYFKVHGEHQGESMADFSHFGGEEALRFRLTGPKSNISVSDELEDNVSIRQASPGENTDTERKARNQSIIAFTNDEILKGDSDTSLVRTFHIQYLDSSDSLINFNRNNTEYYPGHHWAGYTALSPEGLRYNYALPAYNRKQVEVAFSTVEGTGNRTPVNGEGGLPFHEPNGTDGFLKQTEVPAYAHSYLLTSIVGPDYVDVDGNGVSEMDLGYWVKFTYKQITKKEVIGEEDEFYNWRDPFFGAHLDQGLRSDPLDDRGTFVYGEKEIWYLAMAETKTHIAKFSLEDRKDATGADNKLQDTPLTGKRLKKLDNVVLYTRE